MKILHFLLLFGILFLYPLGCTPPPPSTPEPGQIILDSPCSPPCWYQIIPGKTTNAEVPPLLSQIPDFDQERSTKIGPWAGYSEVYRLYFHGDYFKGEILMQDDVVNRIGLFGNFNLSLENTIETFGKPDQVVISRVWTGDIATKSLYLLYPETGLVIRVDQSGFKPITVERADQVDFICFLNADTYFDSLTQTPEIVTSEELAKQILSWPGWGAVLED
uniref:Uncharacterized protein n=1 Tax=Bellilinea caldifistulae TaxID=360411 RepID=A0A7C4KZI2_9CHLR